MSATDPYGINPWQERLYQSGSYNGDAPQPVTPAAQYSALTAQPRAMASTQDNPQYPRTVGGQQVMYFQDPKTGQVVPIGVNPSILSGNAFQTADGGNSLSVGQALTQGYLPFNTQTGQPYQNEAGNGSLNQIYGGTLWGNPGDASQGQSLYQLAGYDTNKAGLGAVQSYYNAGFQNQGNPLQNPPALGQLAAALVPGYGSTPPGNQTPTGAGPYTGQPNYAPGSVNSGDLKSTDLFGPFGTGIGPQPNYISDLTLPTNPQIAGQFNPAFMSQYEGDAARYVNNLAPYYSGNWGQMTPAQMDTGQVPQPTAQTPQSFNALQFLLSGQGYDPATLARMRAGASDAVSQEQAGQLSSAKIAAQQAGLGDSGASLAEQDVINRQAGDARTQALNQIAIQNAQQGIQNLTAGAGMELNRQQSAAGMANQVALQNAANELSAMTQNVQNQQQANQLNTQNQFQQNLARANQQGQTASNIIQGTMGAELAKQAGADTQNTQNTINYNLNNAELQRQRQMTNSQIGENRYSQALGGMLGLAGSANPYAYYGTGAGIGSSYQPNLIGAQTTSNISASLGNQNPYKQVGATGTTQ